MKQLELINKIIELLGLFVNQVKGASSAGLYDINVNAEDILVPLLKEIFDLPDLRNLNRDEKDNFPGIDLAADESRVGFQITSTPTSRKIKDSLTTFFKNDLNKKYDQIKFYILTEKQKSYSKQTFKKCIIGKFDFQIDRDILDFKDLVKKIRSLEFEKIQKVHSILEEQFLLTDNQTKTVSPSKDFRKSSLNNKLYLENLHSSFLEIFFPQYLFFGDLDIDRKEAKAYRKRLGFRTTARKIVFEALKQRNLSFDGDWTCFENKIYTFHNLVDDDIPLLTLIDEGTVERLECDEFYGFNKDQENVFKSLLNYCFQKKLYDKNVRWMHEDRLFVFMPEDETLSPREMEWAGKVKAKRTLFTPIMNKKTDEISYYKHLAFNTHYEHFDNQWYVEIIPDWYISYDGFKKSFYGSENIKWLKRNERNQHVFNHLKFIAYFLSHKDSPTLFSDQSKEEYPFLTFGKFLSFFGHPIINDKDWTRNEDKEAQKRLEDPQNQLPFDGN